MSIGTGIFLAALCLSFVYLYKITMDKWNWRLGAVRILKFVAALAVIGLVIGIGVHLYVNMPAPTEKPRLLNEYAGIGLGMNMDEVKYTKGVPSYVLGEAVVDPPPPSRTGGFDLSTARLIIEIKDIPHGKHVEDFSSWTYQHQDFGISVDFDDDKKVNEITCHRSRSFQDNSAKEFLNRSISFCPEIFGLGDGDTEEKIYELLGKPSSEDIHGVAKTIEYKDFNVWLKLTKKRVYMLGIKQH